MNSKTLLFLAGGIGVLVLLIALVASLVGGISDDTLKRVKLKETALKTRTATMKTQSSEISAVVAEHKAKYSVGHWSETVALSYKNLGAIEVKMAEIRALIAKDDGDDEPKIKNLLTEVSTLTNSTADQVARVHKQAKQFDNFLDNSDAVIGAAVKKANSTSAASLRTAVEQAVADWPNKSSDLQSRLKSVEDAIARMQVIAKEIDGADLSDPVKILDKIDEINALHARASSNNIRNLIDQLYRSWDKILVEMDFRESGWAMEYYHTYKISKMNIVPGGRSTASEETKTEKVSESVFVKHERNLGMTIQSKPTGKYDHEVDNVVQPPMYNRMAPRGQSNHYGEWRGDSWHWNEFIMGAMVGNVLSGPSVSYRDYDDYYDSHRSRRTYYGRSSGGQTLYGSQGTTTKRTLGNAYKKTSGISQRRTQTKQSQQTRYKAHQAQQRAAAQAKQRSSLGGGSRGWGGK